MQDEGQAGGNPPQVDADRAQEVSFPVRECIYGWTAAFLQRGTTITVRIRLMPDDDVPDELMAELRERWRDGIERKWSDHFGCCTPPGCTDPSALRFRVEWVDAGEHHEVRVRNGPGRSNMSLWHTTDEGFVASHEFGHMIGHPDEYTDSNCPARAPVNTGTVMDDCSEVIERLLRPFCDRLTLATTQL